MFHPRAIFFVIGLNIRTYYFLTSVNFYQSIRTRVIKSITRHDTIQYFPSHWTPETAYKIKKFMPITNKFHKNTCTQFIWMRMMLPFTQQKLYFYRHNHQNGGDCMRGLHSQWYLFIVFYLLREDYFLRLILQSHQNSSIF